MSFSELGRGGGGGGGGRGGGGGGGGGRGRGRGQGPERLLDRMHACHARIRQFLDACARIADRERVDAEVRESAAAAARYFGGPFLLHVADEEESILPRVDAEAARSRDVRAEHARDEAEVGTLTALCATLAARPDGPADELAQLASLVAALGPRVRAHLESEEQALLPLLATLAPDVERTILDEMAARRAAQRAGEP